MSDREIDLLWPSLAIVVVGLSVTSVYKDTHKPPVVQQVTVQCPDGKKTVVPAKQEMIIVQCEVERS